jgi:hypothetical protein
MVVRPAYAQAQPAHATRCKVRLNPVRRPVPSARTLVRLVAEGGQTRVAAAQWVLAVPTFLPTFLADLLQAILQSLAIFIVGGVL